MEELLIYQYKSSFKFNQPGITKHLKKVKQEERERPGKRLRENKSELDQTKPL